MADTPIRCAGKRPNGRPCNNLLGWRGMDDRIIVKIGGRKIGGIVPGPGFYIECEHCHARWLPIAAGKTRKSA